VLTRAMIRVGATLVLAMGMAVSASSIASASPAARSPRTCTIQRGIFLESSPARVGADNLEVCIVNGKPVVMEFLTTIYQENSAGKFVLVASGTGVASYTCNGTTKKTYMGEGEEDTFACG
jgi:hypothetical protein